MTHEEIQMEKIMGKENSNGLNFENAKQVMISANLTQDTINESLKKSLRIDHVIRD